MSPRPLITRLDRVLYRARTVWRDLRGLAVDPASFEPTRADLPDADLDRLYDLLRECIAPGAGELSLRARLAGVCRAYLLLDDVGRRRFFELLASRFDTDPEAVDRAINRFNSASDPAARRLAAHRLRSALRPPWLRLLSQFNRLPNGLKFLVDLRADLIPLARESPTLGVVERELKGLLATWFDLGALDLRRITWQSSAALLEKLATYEAVHEVRGWDDLKDRLDADRRCFAFFHPRMPDEPLIFVQVALTSGMADTIDRLLDGSAPVQDPAEADTAIFYSISNAQPGLVGISFGEFLIKRVIETVRDGLEDVENFATLSPIPGFRRWLDDAVRRSEAESDGSDSRQSEWIRPAAFEQWPITADSLRDPVRAAVVKPTLLPLCAHYLVHVKRADGRALDPVANFHLSNGARVERLQWAADSSDKGMEQSFGIMVNYAYDRGGIELNQQCYGTDGRTATSAAVRKLAKAGERLTGRRGVGSASRVPR